MKIILFWFFRNISNYIWYLYNESISGPVADEEQIYQKCKQEVSNIFSAMSSLIERRNSLIGQLNISGDMNAEYTSIMNRAASIANDCRQFSDWLNEEVSYQKNFLGGQMRDYGFYE